jgi:hypothetical protein
VQLNGSGSISTNPASLSYVWKLSAPAGSHTTLTGATSVQASFVVDVPGVYQATLTVAGGSSSSSATAKITAKTDTVVANPGANQSVLEGVNVQIDGSGSTASSGAPLVYSWTLSAPTGSRSSLLGTTYPQTAFVPDVPGTYTVTLSVTDTFESSSAPVTITVADLPPVADAGVDQVANVGTPITLDGSGSADPDGESLTYAWTITAKPTGSSPTLSPANAVQTQFTADKEGVYTVKLTATDSASASGSTTVNVTAQHAIARLSHDVIDADYSKRYDVIVMASGNPSNALYIYNPDGGTERSVGLDAGTPLAVSVDLDGGAAIVAHADFLSYVALGTGAVTKIPTSLTPTNVALGAEAYLFPTQATTTSTIGIYSVSLSTTPTVTQSASAMWGGGTMVKLHPSGTVLYGLDSSYLYNFPLSGGVAQYAWEYDYSSSYGSCSNFWFSATGDHLFTSCGDVFNATPAVVATDMSYAGPLQMPAAPSGYAGPTVLSLAHGNDGGTVFAVSWDGGQIVSLDPASFNQTGTVNLPNLAGTAPGYPMPAQFVFARSDGTRHYAIVSGTDGNDAGVTGIVTY